MTRVQSKDLKVMDYRGTEVFLTSGTNPRFYANAAGQHFWGGSWDTLRKKLDGAVGFEPFDALRLSRDRGRDFVEQIRIIGANMETSEWILESTKETRAASRDRIKFYHDIFPLSARDRLEAHLGEMEQWTRQESDIAAAKEADRAELAKLKLQRPDGD